jgi:hypothetical protein
VVPVDGPPGFDARCELRGSHAAVQPRSIVTVVPLNARPVGPPRKGHDVGNLVRFDQALDRLAAITMRLVSPGHGSHHWAGLAPARELPKTTPKRPRVAPKRPRNGVFPGILVLYEGAYLQGFPFGALLGRGIIIRVSGVRVPPPAPPSENLADRGVFS